MERFGRFRLASLKPVFFETPAALGAWLAGPGSGARELLVGFRKKATGRVSLTYQEALDEALAVGWIDGVRRRLDAERYVIRFTPRRRGSVWSRVNIVRVRALAKLGRMTEAGLAAFGARDERKTRRYSFERKNCALAPEYEQRFRRHQSAWAFFKSQPPGYRRTAAWWVMSAVREDTRLRRLDALVDLSARKRRLGP